MNAEDEIQDKAKLRIIGPQSAASSGAVQTGPTTAPVAGDGTLFL